MQMRSKKPSDRAVLLSLAITFFASSVISVIASRWDLLLLDENQILYLCSTTAQVIAALYGLTLAGFAIFRNELTREKLADETVSEVVDLLQQWDFKLFLLITTLVTVALAAANAAITLEGSNSSELLRWALNVGQSSFFTSIAAIALFTTRIIRPDRIARMSDRLRIAKDPAAKSTPRPPSEGDLGNFVRAYAKVEALLRGFEGQLGETAADLAMRSRRMPLAQIAHRLLKLERITVEQHDDLVELISLRNAVLHSPSPAVSQEAVNRAEQIGYTLDLKLKPPVNDDADRSNDSEEG